MVKGSLVILKCVKENGLYILDGKTLGNTGSAMSHSIKNETDLWQKILGHITGKGLTELSKQGSIKCSNIYFLGICEQYCIYGKKTTVKFGGWKTYNQG